MADPSIQTFCCHRVRDASESLDFLSEFNSDSYNKVCLISSTIGICGAVYQILPRKKSMWPHRWSNVTYARGRHIVVWLAVADLLASLGVFLRSLLWLNYSQWSYLMNDDTITILCAVSAAWIQYFYTATWLWTMVYAIDMWLVLKVQPGYPFRYHTAVWSIPAVLTSIGLSILYIPNANCHTIKSLSTTLLRILPNYFASYLPMAAVMIVNPVIYRKLSSQLEVLIAQTVAQFTNKERHVVDLLRIKFSLINLSFYMCWLPNLVNGVLLWTLWFNLPQSVLLGLWYIMALMNPLQAVFNAFVYRRWTGGEGIYIPCVHSNFCDTKQNRELSSGSTRISRPNESTPLVGSSINCSSASDDEERVFNL